MSKEKVDRWVRPEPARTGPRRGFGGYYRSADREVEGKVFRGVPLNTAEDIAVEVVRTAYRIADSQIDRGMRIARDIRGAADQRGIKPREAIDASERLVAKALLAGLQWLEGAASEDDHPLRRLAMAEYRMVGSMLGLNLPKPGKRKRTESGTEEAKEPAAGGDSGQRDGGSIAIRVINTAPDQKRRPLLSTQLMLSADKPRQQQATVTFHPPHGTGRGSSLSATVRWTGSRTVNLEIRATVAHRAGIWTAGLYDADGGQDGVLTITL